MKTWLKTDLAYLAGFIDGEGCFFLGYRKIGKRNCFPTSVLVAQTSQAVLHEYQASFGGTVHDHGKTKKNRPAWMWAIHGENAERLTRLVRPYLKVKKEQAEVFMQMRGVINKHSRGVDIPAEEVTHRLALVNKMRELRES
jgi:hypothetical protein